MANRDLSARFTLSLAGLFFVCGNVPESADYTLAYSLDLPSAPNYTSGAKTANG